MNPDTGELRRLKRGDATPEGFEPLPLALQRAALVAGLRGAQSATVDLHKRGPLQNWAKKKRKAKIAAASRRRNRSK